MALIGDGGQLMKGPVVLTDAAIYQAFVGYAVCLGGRTLTLEESILCR